MALSKIRRKRPKKGFGSCLAYKGKAALMGGFLCKILLRLFSYFLRRKISIAAAPRPTNAKVEGSGTELSVSGVNPVSAAGV